MSNQLLAEHKVIKAVNKGIGDILNTELMLNNDAVKTQIILTKKENYGEHSILHHMNFELRWEI